jgi:hypothetical protein
MPITFEFPYTNENIPQIQILFLGPQKSGKSYACAYFVPLLGVPQDRLVVCGPPSAKFLANKLQVPWTELKTGKDEQEKILRPIYENPKHQLIIIDEFDTAMSMGGRTMGSVALWEIINNGRSLGKSYIGIAHGSAYVSKNTIQNADVVFFSVTGEKNLLDYADNTMYMDIENPRELLSHLPKWRFLVWTPNDMPRFRGFAWVENGEFITMTPEELKGWQPKKEESVKDTEKNAPKTLPDSTENQDSAITVTKSIGQTVSQPIVNGIETN